MSDRERENLIAFVRNSVIILPTSIPPHGSFSREPSYTTWSTRLDIISTSCPRINPLNQVKVAYNCVCMYVYIYI